MSLRADMRELREKLCDLDAGRRMQEELIRLGITEDELVADCKEWRRSRT
jgi:hypothetical protein